MMYLTLGVILFISIHLLPAFTTARQNLIEHFGRSFYLTFFTLVSIIGLTLIIIGKIAAPYQNIWTPPFWTVLVPVAIMPLVFILLVSAFIQSNIQRIVRHPMLYGVLLWSFVHLSANGDLASIILFSSFAAFCIVDLFSAYKRTPANSPATPKHVQPISFNGELAAIEPLAKETTGRKPSSFSKLNPRGQLSERRYSIARDIAVVIIGVCVYLIVLYFHNVLFGISTFRL